ncbi:hypothetical protein ACED16_02505 [Enterobacter hormaechei]
MLNTTRDKIEALKMIMNLANVVDHTDNDSINMRLHALESAVMHLKDDDEITKVVESLDKACCTAYEDNHEEYVMIAKELKDTIKRLDKLESVVLKMLTNPAVVSKFQEIKATKAVF